VTSGWGTTTQTTNFLGSFAVPTTGWSAFGWVPLRDADGNLATITLGGSTNTLKLFRDPTPPLADVNVNFLMLVPAPGPLTLSAAIVGANVQISFPTQSGFSYQIEYKNDLLDANWLTLGSLIAGDGSIKTVSDPLVPTRRFYRARIQ
jgi:hypothetical protein